MTSGLSLLCNSRKEFAVLLNSLGGTCPAATLGGFVSASGARPPYSAATG
jgi:hypothetical protein